jgi:uncharacterized protein (DUF2461 family)
MAENKDPFKTFKELFNNPKWFSKVEKHFEKQFKTAFGSFDKNFKKAMASFNLTTSKDLQKIQKRISELEKRIGKLEKPKRTAARRTTASRTKKQPSPTGAGPARTKKTTTKK